jgi:RimJ/RimL family protein N-acetyltransferase
MEPRDATESSQSVIRYDLDFQVIQARTDVANAASIRVLEKLRMSSRQRAIANRLDTLFYTLPRSHL